jgi:branched-chain amino acid transport system permease protein
MGVNVNNMKVVVFGIGSMPAGIGGVGDVHHRVYRTGLVHHDAVDRFPGCDCCRRSRIHLGALVAGLFLQYVPSYASDLGQALTGAVYGES